MKKKLLILIILTIVFLIPSGCGTDNNELYKKVEFGTYSADLSNAKYIGISNKKDNSTASTNLFGKSIVYAADDVVDLEAIKDNELVTVDTNNEAKPLEIQDEESNSIELPYTPLYVETRGDFTLTIAVHNLIFDEDSDYFNLQYQLDGFLPLLLSSDDPISFMFNTGVSDFGYHITSFDYEYGSALNLLIINNETGKIFDLSSTLFKEVDEPAGNALRVDNLSINENKLTFSVHYEFEMLSEIIKLSYDYELDSFDKSIYSPGLSSKEFTPVLTDQYYNTLFISDSNLKIIDNNEVIIDLPENIDYINSEYFLVDNEIYLLTFYFDDYKIDIGKINDKASYQKIASYTISKFIDVDGIHFYSKYAEFIETTKENTKNKVLGEYFNSDEFYYNIESYGYKTYIKDNYFYFLGGSGGFTHKSFKLDLCNTGEVKDQGFELLSLEDETYRKFFINDKLFYIKENEIGLIDFFNTIDKEVLISDIRVINITDNFTKYLDEHIYFEVEDLTDNTIKNVYINVKTGSVSFDEPATENEVTFKTEIK